MGPESAIKAFLNEYGAKPQHKAFAYSVDGPWGWASEHKTEALAEEAALSGCEKHRKAEQDSCRVINVNGTWTQHAERAAGYVEQYRAKANKEKIAEALARIKAGADATDGSWKSIQPIYRDVGAIMWLKGFEDLERLMSEWNDPKQRQATGSWKLTLLEDAVSSFYRKRDRRDAEFKLIQEWKQKAPRSVWASLAEAEYWRKSAYDARGHGFANTVTAEGWQLFAERIARMEQSLLASKNYASSNPIWYQYYLNAGRLLNWPIDKTLRVFDEAVREHRSYHPIYSETLVALMPRWGGSHELVDSFIRKSAADGVDGDGDFLYAELYARLSTAEGPDFELFRDTKASWPRIKKGFDDWLRRYPRSHAHLNRYALLACRANDEQTFASLRARVGANVIQAEWPQNYSLEICDRRASEKKIVLDSAKPSGPASVQSAVASDERNVLVDRLMAVSGLTTSLRRLPSQIVTGAKSSGLDNAASEIRAKVLEAYSQAYPQDAFVQGVHSALLRHHDPRQLERLLKILSTPLAKSMAILEAREPAPSAIQRYALEIASTPLSADRRALIRKLDIVSEASALLTRVTLSSLETIALAAAEDCSDARTAVSLTLQQRGPEIEEVVRNSMQVTLAYMYRDVSAADLRSYLKLQDSADGKWFRGVVHSAIEERFKVGDELVGKEIGRLVREQRERRRMSPGTECGTKIAMKGGGAKAPTRRAANAGLALDARDCLNTEDRAKIRACAERFR